MYRNLRKTTFAFLLVVLLLPAAAALANKSAVAISAPEAAAKGTEIVIRLSVRHSGNNMFHHTDWVVLKADGKEVARWEFSAFSLPEAEDFTREFRLTIDAPVRLEAQSDCNLHGSAGIVTRAVGLK